MNAADVAKQWLGSANRAEGSVDAFAQRPRLAVLVSGGLLEAGAGCIAVLRDRHLPDDQGEDQRHQSAKKAPCQRRLRLLARPDPFAEKGDALVAQPLRRRLDCIGPGLLLPGKTPGQYRSGRPGPVQHCCSRAYGGERPRHGFAMAWRASALFRHRGPAKLPLYIGSVLARSARRQSVRQDSQVSTGRPEIRA